MLISPVEVTVGEAARLDSDCFEGPGEVELLVHEVLVEGLGHEVGVGLDRSDEVHLNDGKEKSETENKKISKRD